MVTLEQAKVGMADKVDQQVIDEFRRRSYLLDKLVFDDAVSPGTGGSTLTYGYIKLKTPSTASFRALNSGYSNNEAIREKESCDLKIFGGSFKLDRVIIKSSGAIDELSFQTKEKVKGAVNLFHYTSINGDSTKNELEFDGLNKLVSGSDTEYNNPVYELTSDTDLIPGKIYFTKTSNAYKVVTAPAKESLSTYYEIVNYADLSNAERMDKNYQEFLDGMDEFVSKLDEKPTMLLMNTKMHTKMKGIARRAGYYSRSEDAFGRSVDLWDNIPMVDLGDYFNGSKTVPCVPISEIGTTDIYAITIAKDGFLGVSLQGENVITSNLPDLSAPGTVKEGDVEMVAAVALKNTKKAGVFRNIKVV